MFLLFFYLPTDPTLSHQMSVEQDTDLAWPWPGIHVDRRNCSQLAITIDKVDVFACSDVRFV